MSEEGQTPKAEINDAKPDKSHRLDLETPKEEIPDKFQKPEKETTDQSVPICGDEKYQPDDVMSGLTAEETEETYAAQADYEEAIRMGKSEEEAKDRQFMGVVSRNTLHLYYHSKDEQPEKTN